METDGIAIIAVVFVPTARAYESAAKNSAVLSLYLQLMRNKYMQPRINEPIKTSAQGVYISIPMSIKEENTKILHSLFTVLKPASFKKLYIK